MEQSAAPRCDGCARAYDERRERGSTRYRPRDPQSEGDRRARAPGWPIWWCERSARRHRRPGELSLRCAGRGGVAVHGDARLRARKEERAAGAGDDRRRARVAWIRAVSASTLLFTKAAAGRLGSRAGRAPPPRRPRRACPVTTSRRSPSRGCSGRCARGRKVRAVRMRTRNAPGIALRPKSRRENPVAMCADHRDPAGGGGSPMARDRRLENPPALGVEHRVSAGDRSGRHVRELSFSDTAELRLTRPSHFRFIARTKSAVDDVRALGERWHLLRLMAPGSLPVCRALSLPPDAVPTRRALKRGRPGSSPPFGWPGSRSLCALARPLLRQHLLDRATRLRLD